MIRQVEFRQLIKILQGKWAGDQGRTEYKIFCRKVEEVLSCVENRSYHNHTASQGKME